jgi:hypothetical protein
MDQDLKGWAMYVLQEVIFQLRGVNVFVGLQCDAFEGLVHIDTGRVDTPELVMEAHTLSRANGVCSSGDERNGPQIIDIS